MAFYRIKDAAEKIGVQPHVLRFWESQFPSIKPPKTTRGQRLYSDEDVENFLKIKVLLYNEGFSIPGAKKVLKEQKMMKSKAQAENLELETLSEESEEALLATGEAPMLSPQQLTIHQSPPPGAPATLSQSLSLQESVQRSLQRAERSAQSTLERALLGEILQDLKALRSFVRNI
jgi:DNA-binding transcriptional MerR regulator